MQTLKKRLLAFGLNQSDTDKHSKLLMDWIRERHAESPYSIDEIRDMISNNRTSWPTQFDVKSFFDSDNPCYEQFRAVMFALSLNASEMYRIILGRQRKYQFRLPPMTSSQQSRNSTDIFGDNNNTDSGDLN